MTLTPEQIAEGWLLHDGSRECPIKDDRTSFAYFNRLGGLGHGARRSVGTDWSHNGSSWDITAYRIIEAHGADAAPARPTPFPRDYSDLVFSDDGWSQTIIVDGKRPEWLRDDDGTSMWLVDRSSCPASKRFWESCVAIRVRRREPKRETVRCWVKVTFEGNGPYETGDASIDLIDGEPDLSTLKIAGDAL